MNLRHDVAGLSQHKRIRTAGRMDVSEPMDDAMKPQDSLAPIRLMLFMAIGLVAALSGPLAVLAQKL
jgi:hypothetical protein